MKTLKITMTACIFFLSPSCKKYTAEVEGEVHLDYRDKYVGTYYGISTEYTFIQGVSTTYTYSNQTDSISKDANNDSSIVSRRYGSFKLPVSGTATVMTGTKSSRTITFRNDSVIGSNGDWSALGGSWWNSFQGKK